MNRYTFDEITEGMQESFEVEVTEEMQKGFTQISGDINPMHLDGEYAKAHGYEGRLVYGMLTASLYSTLAGVYIPGEHCVLQEVKTMFRAPVYIGDRLTVTGVVEEKHEVFRRIRLSAKVVNQNGKTVSKAVIYAGVIG